MQYNHFVKNLRSTTALVAFVVVVSLFGVTNDARAGIWGETYAATAWKQVTEELMKNLRGMITGAFKQAVGQVMNTQITAMIGGGNGKGAMFITNWQTFLVTDPQKQVDVYMNDFFSMTTRGRNSSSNYRLSTTINNQPVAAANSAQKSWFAQEGIIDTTHAADTVYESHWETVNGKQVCVGNVPCMVSYHDKNYYKWQEDNAKAAINRTPCQIDLMDYVSSPSEIFSGSWRGFNAFFSLSNPCNNPASYVVNVAQPMHAAVRAQEQRKADIQAIAYQGFKAATGAGGIVKTPGITIGQLVSKAQGFSFDVMSGSQDYGQLISSGISAAITASINVAAQKGINAADEAIQSGLNESTGALSKISGGTVNLSLGVDSLANVDWNNAVSGQSSEFNNGVNDMNGDTQSGLAGSSQKWGDMNFSGTGISGGSSSSQDSYAAFDSYNFETAGIAPTFDSAQSFDPNKTWNAPVTSYSNNPVWVGGN